jgi:hypothetical protein
MEESRSLPSHSLRRSWADGTAPIVTSTPIVPSSFPPAAEQKSRANVEGLPTYGRREGEFAKAYADPANKFIGLSGNQHFDRDVGNRVPTVDSKGYGYHVSAPMYKHITKKYNDAIRQR